VTASALRAEGLCVDAVAEEPTDAGLVRAIVACCEDDEPGGDG
jgi:uroporphyrinogen-III synthase